MNRQEAREIADYLGNVAGRYARKAKAARTEAEQAEYTRLADDARRRMWDMLEAARGEEGCRRDAKGTAEKDQSAG